jgi:putative membrane protein
MLYNSLLAFHIVSLISWFAMLFYLPRLYVYHSENRNNREFVSVVKIMERKLMKFIGTPAMWATVISGGYLAYESGFISQPWLHIKITLVIALMGYHIYLEKLRVELKADRDQHSGKFFRVLNEIPTILMLIIVPLVVFKPF